MSVLLSRSLIAALPGHAWAEVRVRGDVKDVALFGVKVCTLEPPRAARPLWGFRYDRTHRPGQFHRRTSRQWKGRRVGAGPGKAHRARLRGRDRAARLRRSSPRYRRKRRSQAACRHCCLSERRCGLYFRRFKRSEAAQLSQQRTLSEAFATGTAKPGLRSWSESLVSPYYPHPSRRRRCGNVGDTSLTGVFQGAVRRFSLEKQASERGKGGSDETASTLPTFLGNPFRIPTFPAL